VGSLAERPEDFDKPKIKLANVLNMRQGGRLSSGARGVGE